jgi:hypothetical protein
MSFLSEVPRETLQSLFNTVALDKPSVGSTVRIVGGQKHRGKVGIVKRHQRDGYVDPFRYGNSASHMMTQARGRYGYIVLVQEFDGPTFWVKADYCMVCVEKEWVD